MNFICFDLEGPLSPQDNGYELMKLIPDGDKLFEVISRYDDLLTLQKKKDYEPGDTLALIVPFLLHAKISQTEMELISSKATLIDGAKEFITELRLRGWWVGDITTCYQHYGYPITERIGILPWNVACTRFPSLDYFREIIKEDDLSIVEQVEKEIVTLEPKRDDEKILERLDMFFNRELAGNVLGAVMKLVRPLGGLRKVRELRRFAKRDGFKLNQVIVVGDSITDSKMLEAVKKESGIAVAFNANEYALRCANVGLASTNLGDLRLVAEAWEKGGKKEVEEVVKEKEKEGGLGNRNYFHWLANRRNFEKPLAVHKRIRDLVREEAAKLG
ncbi:hypothetical protein ES706_02114 [subsurface metagenome]